MAGMAMEPENNTLKNALSFEEVEEILIYFSTSILEKNSEEEIFWHLAKNVISRLGFVDCVIYSVNSARGVLEQRAAHGPKNPRKQEIYEPIAIPIGRGISGFVANTGIAERVADTRQDSRYIIDDEERRSELAVPIILNNRVVCVIDCEHPQKDFFSDQHLRILKAIASICAVKLSNLEAQQIVRKKEEKLLKAKQQMAELKILAIRAQMNPHFVFNALNAVQHFITSNDKENALKFISAFGKLVRLYLKHLEHDTINLYQEMDIMEQYLKLQKLRYEGMFDYAVNYHGDGNEEIHVPALISQLLIEEGVENLAKNKIAGTLTIDIEVFDTQVRVLLDVAIPADEKNRRLEHKYANEITDWADHVKLLNKIKKYNIEVSSKIHTNSGIVHHITDLMLPCL